MQERKSIKPNLQIPKLARGFTLIEIIVVMVVLGVISVGISTLYVQGVQQYMDANSRQELLSGARLSLERISRELRDALPNSVRVSADGNCVEFVPVLQGGHYLSLPLGSPDTRLEAIPLSLPTAGTAYVAVMPLVSTEVYGSRPALADFDSVSAGPTADTVYVNFSASFMFARGSAAGRFFLAGTPISFCVSGNELRRYNGYGNLAAQPGPGSGLAGGDLLSQNLAVGDASNPVFRYNAGALERNALLQMQFSYSAGGESARLAHEVMVRNVP